MKQVFREFLFTKHILVCDHSQDEGGPHDTPETEKFGTLVTLAKRFGIRITEGAAMAHPQMIKDAAMFLGEYVPEPFYRGFPQTVRELTNEQRLFDQLYHYTQTYGMGWFDEVGHSTMEEVFKRLAFNEKTEPKEFRILSEGKAEIRLLDCVRELLAANRPLNIDQQILVWEAWETFGANILPEWIPCKQTAVLFLCKTRSVVDFGRYLKLPDVIKVLDYIQYNNYGSENLKKLNLKNQDRKLITRLIDACFGDCFYASFGNEMQECFEKRRIWCGLLHHIHYQPKNKTAESFVAAIRNGMGRSAYSFFEHYMDNDATIDAAEYLKKAKGSGTLLRNLNYILSRCKDEKEVKGVLSCLTK